MTARLDIHLPMPPSVNRIWRNRNGRSKPHLDTRYASWKRVCDNLCLAHGWHKAPVTGHFSVYITLDERKRRSNWDADNRIKPVLDWLQQAGIIANDSKADTVSVSWGAVGGSEPCHVTLFPAAQAGREAA